LCDAKLAEGVTSVTLVLGEGFSLIKICLPISLFLLKTLPLPRLLLTIPLSSYLIILAFGWSNYHYNGTVRFSLPASPSIWVFLLQASTAFEMTRSSPLGFTAATDRIMLDYIDQMKGPDSFLITDLQRAFNEMLKLCEPGFISAQKFKELNVKQLGNRVRHLYKSLGQYEEWDASHFGMQGLAALEVAKLSGIYTSEELEEKGLSTPSSASSNEAAGEQAADVPEVGPTSSVQHLLRLPRSTIIQIIPLAPTMREVYLEIHWTATRSPATRTKTHRRRPAHQSESATTKMKVLQRLAIVKRRGWQQKIPAVRGRSRLPILPKTRSLVLARSVDLKGHHHQRIGCRKRASRMSHTHPKMHQSRPRWRLSNHLDHYVHRPLRRAKLPTTSLHM
jgi:hypothetical protein